MERKVIMQIKGLKKTYYAGKKNEVCAVDDVSFDVYEGETFGLVGESGSGKSTTGKLLMKLEEATAGEVLFLGESLQQKRSRKDLLAFRKNIQMIFQDPYASLNPRMTVREIIGGPLEVHGLVANKRERNQIVEELLTKVGLNRSFADRYPREFSGGQCQRIGIARALAVKPRFIIADEAISALDVSIQAQVVNLLRQLKREEKLTFLFIAHDLSMVKYVSNRIAVMNRGRILELASSEDVYQVALHPYTESLLSSIPEPDPLSEQTRERIPYQVPEMEDSKRYQLYEIEPEHFVYCQAEDVPFYQAKAQKKRSANEG